MSEVNFNGDEANGELIPQGGGDSIPLLRTPLVLGRRESCDVCLQYPNVSSRHCELLFKQGFWIIKDLDSTNGIKVNDSRVYRKILRSGDMVTVGQRRFRIQYTESGTRNTLEEFEKEMEETMNIPLLEKAGLAHPPKHQRKKVDPNEALSKSYLNEEERKEREQKKEPDKAEKSPPAQNKAK